MFKKFIKSFLTILIVVIFPFFASSCGQEKKQSAEEQDNIITKNLNTNKPLDVLVSADYPPFEFRKDGQIVGFDIDLIQMIAKELGMNIQIRDVPWPSIIPSISNDQADVGISAMSKNSERDKFIDFSSVYYKNQIVLLYKKNNVITSLKDLAGQAIGVQTGSIMNDFIVKYMSSTNIKFDVLVLDNNLIALENLKSGKISGLLIEKAQALNMIFNDDSLTLMEMDKDNEGEMFNGSNLDEGYAIVTPNNSALLPKINAAIDTLNRNGSIQLLKEKWLNENTKIK